MPRAVKRTRPYQSPRRREQAAATRRAILEAAQRLFVRQGYAATSMPAIAAEAGVALKTVYVAFETKAKLLNALWDVRLGGDEEAIPVFERAWYRSLVAEPDPERKLRIVAAQARVVKTRSGALLEVIRNAASADVEIAALWSRIQAKLLDVQRSIVEQLDARDALASGLDVATATDILWTLNHPNVWHLLVRERGWTGEQYEQWLGDVFCSQLLGAEDNPRGATRPTRNLQSPPKQLPRRRASSQASKGARMQIDLDAYREESRATWGQMAAGWEARHDWIMDITGRVNTWLVERADPRPGQTVLDLAAGTGDLGFIAAERVGAEGRVISADFAPEMVEVARRRGEALGLTNVDYRVLDAEGMDLDADSVDAVVCRWGYMLMADPAAALSETRRVLRDGGPLTFAVWRTPDRNPWAAMPAMTLIQRGHLPPPDPDAPGIFALGEESRVRELVLAAGFGEPELEEIAVEFHNESFDDLWESLIRLAGPLARAISALPDDERQATREAIRQSVAPYRREDGTYAAPGATWAVLAR